MSLHNVAKLTSKVIFSSNHEFSFSIFFSSQLTTPTVTQRSQVATLPDPPIPGATRQQVFSSGVWKVSVLLPGLLLKKKQVSLLYYCPFQGWARWTRWLQFHSWEQDLRNKTGEGDRKNMGPQTLETEPPTSQDLPPSPGCLWDREKHMDSSWAKPTFFLLVIFLLQPYTLNNVPNTIIKLKHLFWTKMLKITFLGNYSE